MKKPAIQAHGNGTQPAAAATDLARRHSVCAAGLSDNRPQASVQRNYLEMADRSPQSRQLKAVQDIASRGRVRQMAFNTKVVKDRLNVIGENHQKSEERRKQERAFAEEQGLTYLFENEFGVVKNDTVMMGDPTNLRILFAVASVREKVAALQRGDVVDPQPFFDGIQWALGHVQGDVIKYVQDHDDDTLATLFATLGDAIRRRRPAIANNAIIDITQVLSPGHMLGSSSDISRARSESMHEAATEGSTAPGMWMIGQHHAEDIDDAFPERKYILLDDKSMDAEMKDRG